MNIEDEDTPRAFQIDRRTFIVSGSAAVVALAAPRAKAAVADPALLSVGYWGGVPRLQRRSGIRGSLIAAEKLTTSDPSLIRDDAQITVRGLWQAPQNRATRVRYTIDALFPSDGLESKAPVYAWAYSTMQRTAAASSLATFRYPVEAQGVVELRFGKTTADAERVANVSFAVTRTDGALMLDRGTYVFAFLDSGTPAPDWSAVELVPGTNASEFEADAGLIAVRSGSSLMKPWFDYLVISFDSHSEPKKTGE